MTRGVTAAHEPASSSFSRSRPSELLFPLEEFRKTCAEVIASDDAATILQLGSPSGYPPLRRYLLEQARAEGAARESDDILITSGCQQAFDLLQRTDRPRRDGADRRAGVSGRSQRVRARGRAADRRSGGTATASIWKAWSESLRGSVRACFASRRISRIRPAPPCRWPRARHLLRIAQAAGVIVIENDIYGPLCYEGEPLAAIKRLDQTGDTILLRSFSKVAFPGIARGLGHRPARADREADRSQAVERSAHRSALAGRAAALRRIGTPGAASAAHAGGRGASVCRRRSKLAKNICPQERDSRGRAAE